ncbi:hypothetical protein S245_045892, partial [Arachis hypogaea]
TTISELLLLCNNPIAQDAAVLIAFLISAVFHELCIAVPCHKFKLWAFIGIMFQVRTYFPSESSIWLAATRNSNKAGRARYGSNFPVGEVICIDAGDLPLLHSSLNSPLPTLK